MGQSEDPIDADAVVRTVAPTEEAAFYANHLQGRFAGVLPEAAASSTCLYTVTPDHRFIIDTHPRMDRVLVVSACSATASSIPPESAMRSPPAPPARPTRSTSHPSHCPNSP